MRQFCVVHNQPNIETSEGAIYWLSSTPPAVLGELPNKEPFTQIGRITYNGDKYVVELLSNPPCPVELMGYGPQDLEVDGEPVTDLNAAAEIVAELLDGHGIDLYWPAMTPVLAS